MIVQLRQAMRGRMVAQPPVADHRTAIHRQGVRTLVSPAQSRCIWMQARTFEDAGIASLFRSKGCKSIWNIIRSCKLGRPLHFVC